MKNRKKIGRKSGGMIFNTLNDLFTTQSFSDNSRLSISILLGILLKSK
jgi:hypothetical protein